MCHYNVLKCVRCRRIHPQEYVLCENLEQGAICIDHEKLANSSNNRSTFRDEPRSVSSSTKSNTKPSAIDLFYLLKHNYEYTDGCLSCGG